MAVFEDHAPSVATAIIILATISLIVFPLRIYTRSRHSTWGWDDWAMAAAVIPYAALTVFCLGSAFLGVGVHKEKLTEHQTQLGMMWFWGFEICFCLTIIPVKLSVTFMLMRIAVAKPNYVAALWVMASLFVAMNLISFFYIIFRCTPISFAWDTSIPGGSCLPSQDLADFYYADTTINILTDWFCAFIPVPLLWHVELTRNAKISVVFLLSLGVLASVSACIRLKYTVNLNNSQDYLYSVGDVVIWGYAENGVGFIVGCIATLRPLFRRMFQLGGHDDSTDELGDIGGDGYDSPSGLPPHYTEPRKPARTKTKSTFSSQLHRKGSVDSTSTSGEHMLRDMPGGNLRGIHVHRTVMQSRD